MTFRSTLLVASLFALSYCRPPAQANEAPPEPLHYRISASIAPGSGVLTSDVTITIPRAQAAAVDAFILGKRFELQPIEAHPHASFQIEPTDKPVTELQKIRVRYQRPPQQAVTLRFRYEGPIFAGEKQDRLGYTPDAIEMALELMWLPFPAEINKSFTVDAELRGVPQDLVVVAQGDIEHTGDRVRIQRTWSDVDFAWTAVRGLKSVSAPGVEFYARDFADPLVIALRKHALASAEFHQKWFGPLPGGPIRLAVVPRKNGGAYARTGYTIISEGRATGEPPPEFSEMSRASTVAHEFAHAWWAPADPLTEDYWLSESFAQYASIRYVESVFGRELLDTELKKSRASAENAGPVLGHGRPSRTILYGKGPLLLMQLEQSIGRDKLDTTLAQLGRHPPRKTQEFLDALGRIAGVEAARAFEAKLRAP
jgi:aminopeptidase N